MLECHILFKLNFIIFTIISVRFSDDDDYIPPIIIETNEEEAEAENKTSKKEKRKQKQRNRRKIDSVD